MNCVRYFNKCTESNTNRIPILVPSSNNVTYIKMDINLSNLFHENMMYNTSIDTTTSEDNYLIDLFTINKLSKDVYYKIGAD